MSDIASIIHKIYLRSSDASQNDRDGSVFEQGSLIGDEYKPLLTTLYCYWSRMEYRKLLNDPFDSDTAAMQFNLCLIASQARLLLDECYIPTFSSDMKSIDDSRLIYKVSINADLDHLHEHLSDPFLKAISVLNLPLNQDVLLTPEQLEHLNGFDTDFFSIDSKFSLSLPHKRIFDQSFSLDSGMQLLSFDYQDSIAQMLIPYLEKNDLISESEKSVSEPLEALDITALQILILTSHLKLYLSQTLKDLGFYDDPHCFVKVMHTARQIRTKSGFNLNFMVGSESKLSKSGVFWFLVNKGFVFDPKSFVENISIDYSNSDIDKGESNFSSLSPNYYDLLIRLIADPNLHDSFSEMNQHILDKKWDNVIHLIASLPIFKNC